jgi:hypothetical protein
MGDGASAHDLQRWRPEWKGVEPPLERLGVVLCSGHRADDPVGRVAAGLPGAARKRSAHGGPSSGVTPKHWRMPSV